MRIAFGVRGAAFVEFGEAIARRLPEHALFNVTAETAAAQLGGTAEAPAPEILIATNGFRVDRAILDAHRFIYIQTIGTGYEHIDVAAATEAGVWVANLSAAATGNADSVAELAVLLMLGLARQLKISQTNFAEGRWATPRGAALLEKTACIIGLGDIGSALATRLQAFGMRVVATRRDLSKGGPPGVKLFAATELHQALREADHAIICARADETNRSLIDARALAAMKAGAILINISRGTILDLDAAQASLESGHLGGLGLDVFPQEPFDAKHPLLKHERVLVTPHIAGVTDVNSTRSLKLIAENIERFARGERPRFLLNAPMNPRQGLR